MRQVINPRDFRHQMVLQKPTAGTEDEGGQIDLTNDDNWTDVGRFQLKLYGTGSRELYRAQQVQTNATHVADTIYCERVSQANTSMRWKYGSRVFQISSASDVDEEHQLIRMRLVEKT